MSKVTDRKRRILLVDDHPVLRRGLARLIGQEPDLEVVGEAEDALPALEAMAQVHPDLMIVDITLKSSNGLDLVRQVRQLRPELPILVLSMHNEAFYAERALVAGAQGYLAKGESPARVIEAIRDVLRGDLAVSQLAAARVLGKVVGRRDGEESAGVQQLSDREGEVFRMIGQGLQTRQIAAKLELSVKTVETYRENIKRKLSLSDSVELLQFAIQWTRAEANGG